MRKQVCSTVIVIEIRLAAGVAIAETRDDYWRQCQDSNPDVAIGGCTAIIVSAQEVASLSLRLMRRK